MKGFLRFENYFALFDDQDLLINFIDQAIKEDVGAGDLTTTSVIPRAQEAQAFFLVKEDCVLAGIELAKLIFARIDEGLSFHPVSHDGAFVTAGTVIGRVSGNIQSILKAERLVLNSMQRMSAIATKTNALVEKASPYGVTILDTRKTTPNFRICEKWAVAIGGGKNHRYALYDQILIKDNHIAVAGGIIPATPGGRLALLGEGGKDEAVIPLDKLNMGTPTTVNVTVNGGMDSAETIARRVQTALLDLKRRQGVPLGLT
jgi:nicotinate-nucleotide pyrophosphorylase (carboxylating)